MYTNEQINDIIFIIYISSSKGKINNTIRKINQIIGTIAYAVTPHIPAVSSSFLKILIYPFSPQDSPQEFLMIQYFLLSEETPYPTRRTQWSGIVEQFSTSYIPPV